MRINESRIRQIIREEAHRVLREGNENIINLRMLVSDLRDIGEDELADRLERANRGHGRRVEIDVRYDLRVAKVYSVPTVPAESPSFIDDIPMDVYKKLRSSSSSYYG